jgi:3-deoxy-D-manno-octulosonate 8-phosphate phosphatase (KDO 8-P phosphatase)
MERVNALGITDVYLGALHKDDALEDLVMSHSIEYENVCYMGDDIPDLCVLEKVGLPCCPNDAAPELKQICEYVSPVNGGLGCARDIIEKIMRTHDQWFDPRNDEINLADYTW